MSFVAKGEKKKELQNQDKQTPHTVLQKVSPKPTTCPLRLLSTVSSEYTTGLAYLLRLLLVSKHF